MDIASRLGLVPLSARFIFIVVNIGPPLLMRKIVISSAAMAEYRTEWLRLVTEMRGARGGQRLDKRSIGRGME